MAEDDPPHVEYFFIKPPSYTDYQDTARATTLIVQRYIDVEYIKSWHIDEYGDLECFILADDTGMVLLYFTETHQLVIGL